MSLAHDTRHRCIRTLRPPAQGSAIPAITAGAKRRIPPGTSPAGAQRRSGGRASLRTPYFGRSARATATAASIAAGTRSCPPAELDDSRNLPSTITVGTDWML